MKKLIRTSYRIIGPNSVNGDITVWYAATLEEANRMAKEFARNNKDDEEFDIVKYIGSYKRAPLPVEYIGANNEKTD